MGSSRGGLTRGSRRRPFWVPVWYFWGNTVEPRSLCLGSGPLLGSLAVSLSSQVFYLKTKVCADDCSFIHVAFFKK